MSVDDILNEREKTHGDFDEVASLAYDMKKAIDSYLAFDRKGPDDNNKVLKKKHLISINMILLKIARIICGDPNFDDHWDDIAGYAMLGKGKEMHVMTKRICWRCGDAFLGEENDKEALCGQCAKNECERLAKIKEKQANSETNHFCCICAKEIRKGEFGYESEFNVCWGCSGWGIKKEAENSTSAQGEDYWKDIFINKIKDEFDFIGKRFDLMVDWLKNISEHLVELNESKNSTSSKMEHVPTRHRCGEECETTCFTLKDIDLNKRFCPKCTGEIAGEAWKEKMEHEAFVAEMTKFWPSFVSRGTKGEDE